VWVLWFHHHAVVIFVLSLVAIPNLEAVMAYFGAFFAGIIFGSALVSLNDKELSMVMAYDSDMTHNISYYNVFIAFCGKHFFVIANLVLTFTILCLWTKDVVWSGQQE
jgi:hypothetical protein